MRVACLPRDWDDALQAGPRALRALAENPQAVAMAGDVIQDGETPLWRALERGTSFATINLFLDLTHVVPDTRSMNAVAANYLWWDVAILLHERGGRYRDYTHMLSHATWERHYKGDEAAIAFLACYPPFVWRWIVERHDATLVAVCIAKAALARREFAKQTVVALLSLRRRAPWRTLMQKETLRMVADHLLVPKVSVRPCWSRGIAPIAYAAWATLPFEPKKPVGRSLLRDFLVVLTGVTVMYVVSGGLETTCSCVNMTPPECVLQMYVCVVEALVWILKAILWALQSIQGKV